MSSHQIHEVEAERSKKTFHWTLEVALSGGGLRASAFCLGALLYLVHAGLNEKVKNIASVSGGSITNGFVACRCDYANVREDDFKELARELAHKIAFFGMWRPLYYWTWIYVMAGLALLWLFLSTTGVGVLALFAPSALEPQPKELLWFGTVTLVLSILLSYFRGWPITRWMVATFFADGREMALVYLVGHVKRVTNLADVSKRTMVDHVFCATDLNHGIPFFFSTKEGGRLFSKERGRADGPDVPVHLAVRASASFPPVIPPVRFHLPRRWIHTDDPRTSFDIPPTAIWLTDGGVFNNLGTDWSLSRCWIRSMEYDRRRQGGRKPSWEVAGFGQVQLVVDASQPPAPSSLRRLHFPLLALFAYFVRTMLVMYGSTVYARTQQKATEALVRMYASPKRWRLDPESVDMRERGWGGRDLAEQFDANALQVFAPATSPFRPHPSVPREIASIWARVRLLGGRPFGYAAELEQAGSKFGALWPAREHELVPTTFGSLGRERTLRLIVQGYLMAREALTVGTVTYRPPPIPGPEWFQDLLPFDL